MGSCSTVYCIYMYKVVLTFESVNKNMLVKVYLSSIVCYIKSTIKNYHLLGLLQEQEDPENKNKIILKIQFCFVDWSVLNYMDMNFYFNLLSVITLMMTMKIMMLMMMEFEEAAWPSGQRVGLAIRRSRVRVPLWPLAGFVLGRPEFKFSATFVNSQLVAFCQLGFLILLCCI